MRYARRDITWNDTTGAPSRVVTLSSFASPSGYVFAPADAVLVITPVGAELRVAS